MSPRPLRTLASVTSTFALVAAGIAATTSAAQAVPNVDTTICPGTPVWTGGFTPDSAGHRQDDGRGQRARDLPGHLRRHASPTAPDDNHIYLFDISGSRITNGNKGRRLDCRASGPACPARRSTTQTTTSSARSPTASPATARAPRRHHARADIVTIDRPDCRGLTPSRLTASEGRRASRPGVASATSLQLGVGLLVDPQLALPRVSGRHAPARTRPRWPRSLRAAKKPPASDGATFQTARRRPLDPTQPIVAGRQHRDRVLVRRVAMASVGTAHGGVRRPRSSPIGHPDDFIGPSTRDIPRGHALGSSSRRTDHGSYKLANIDMTRPDSVTPGSPQRHHGVTLGQLPDSTLVTTHTTVNGHHGRCATTNVAVPAPSAPPSAPAVQRRARRAQTPTRAGGEALMTWTINYIRP